MEPITLLKLTRRYPDDGPMVEEWAPAATLQGRVDLLPADGLRVAIDFRQGLTIGQRLVRGVHRYVVDHLTDELGRGERLLLTCSLEVA